MGKRPPPTTARRAARGEPRKGSQEKKKTNSKPKHLHEQEIPYRLRELMKSREEMKNPKSRKRRKAGNKEKPAELGDIPVPTFKRRKREAEQAYIRRMEQETQRVLFLTQNQLQREPEKEEPVPEKSQKKKEHIEAGDEAELPTSTGSEEDQEDQGSTITLHLETVSGSPDVSRASSEAGEGSSEQSEGPSSPTAAEASSTARAAGRQVQLLRRHVRAIEGIEAAITQSVDAYLEWRQQAWGHFQAECKGMCDAITTLTAHIGHAVHYGMALPHAPAIPPMPPPAAPCPAHLPVLPAPIQPEGHPVLRPRRGGGRGHPSHQ